MIIDFEIYKLESPISCIYRLYMAYDSYIVMVFLNEKKKFETLFEKSY